MGTPVGAVVVLGVGPPEPGWANAGRLVSAHKASKRATDERTDFMKEGFKNPIGPARKPARISY